MNKNHENLWVCEHCLWAIESREGNLITKKHYIDISEERKCDWCEESITNDFLYELI